MDWLFCFLNPLRSVKEFVFPFLLQSTLLPSFPARFLYKKYPKTGSRTQRLFGVASLHQGLRLSYLEASAVLVFSWAEQRHKPKYTARAGMKCRTEIQDLALTSGERISHTGWAELLERQRGGWGWCFLSFIYLFWSNETLFHSRSTGTAVITMCPKPNLCSYFHSPPQFPRLLPDYAEEKVIANKVCAHFFPASLLFVLSWRPWSCCWSAESFLLTYSFFLMQFPKAKGNLPYRSPKICVVVVPTLRKCYRAAALVTGRGPNLSGGIYAAS